MTVPRVSVCIRTVNRPASLRAAIESVLAQEFEDLELVVSSDGGALGDLGFADARVRTVVNPGPPGCASNLAYAFGQARGELLAILDDDDAWRPGFLSALVPAFADPRVGVAFSDYAFATGGRTIERRWATRHDDMRAALLERMILPSATVIRRETWLEGEQRVPVLPHMAGAMTVLLCAADGGWAFRHVDQVLIDYGFHPGQMSWNAPAAVGGFIATLEALRFEPGPAEQLRRARLKEAHLKSVGVRVRRGGLRSAAAHLRQARDLERSIGVRDLVALSGLRPGAARTLSRHPRVLATTLPLWERVRPPVR